MEVLLIGVNDFIDREHDSIPVLLSGVTSCFIYESYINKPSRTRNGGELVGEVVPCRHHRGDEDQGQGFIHIMGFFSYARQRDPPWDIKLSFNSTWPSPKTRARRKYADENP